jgi:hypothetical protein
MAEDLLGFKLEPSGFVAWKENMKDISVGVLAGFSFASFRLHFGKIGSSHFGFEGFRLHIWDHLLHSSLAYLYHL